MKLIRAVLVGIIISTPIFFASNSYSTTPEQNFDLWLQETHDFQDGLFKASVAEEWGKAGWSEAVEVELANERAIYEAQLANLKAQTRTSTSTTPTTSVSGQCGGATNGADQFIDRESKGNAGIYNSQGSGAWGCYQIMPGTWASSCSDLGVHGQASAAAQAQCASRLPISAWNL